MGWVVVLVAAVALGAMLVVFLLGAVRELGGGRPLSCLQVSGCGCSAGLVVLGPLLFAVGTLAAFAAMGGGPGDQDEATAVLVLLWGTSLALLVAGVVLGVLALRR